ncbi:hypothetical protein OAT16_11370 [Prolixibacteraceae bacterium]|nr:hypothetical protein [Prolixibacteraceae bacterium]
MRRIIYWLLILFVGVSHTSANEPSDKFLPSSLVCFKDNHPYIKHNNKWKRLASIEDIPIKKYIDYSKEEDLCQWKLLFERYLLYIIVYKILNNGSFLRVGLYEGDQIVIREIELPIHHIDPQN